MEMAMAKQTKNNNRARTQTTVGAAAAAAATATGIKHFYTQNISTVKKHKQTEEFVCPKQRSARKSAEIQNNKTKIKKLQYKGKGNHLKLLINLYLKLILCISQINKTILKIFTIKIKTNFSYTKNYSSKYFINLQQKLQQKATCFQTFSFQFQILKISRTIYHCCKRKNPINYYVKLMLRHFVGICQKRLIPLKRLQQIPESPNETDASSHSILNNLKMYVLNDQEKFTSFKNGVFSRNLNFKLRVEQLKDRKRSPKNRMKCRKNQGFGRKWGLTKIYFKYNCLTELKNVLHGTSNYGSIDFKLQQIFLELAKKCGQLIVSTIKFELYTLKTAGSTKLQNEIRLNRAVIQTAGVDSFKRCYQRLIINTSSTQIKLDLSLRVQRILAFGNEKYGCINSDNQTPFFSCKYGQRNQQIALQLCYDNKNKFSLQNCKGNCNFVGTTQAFKLPKDIENSFAKKYRIIWHSNKQNIYLRAFTSIHDQSGNSTENYCQLKINKILHNEYINKDAAKLKIKLTAAEKTERQFFYSYTAVKCDQHNFNSLEIGLVGRILYLGNNNDGTGQKDGHFTRLGVAKKFSNNLSKIVHLSIDATNKKSPKLYLLQCLPQEIAHFSQTMIIRNWKFQSTRTIANSVAPENNRKYHTITKKQTKFPQISSVNISSRRKEIKLANETNIAKQLQFEGNNNFHQIECKQQKILTQCQHILYSIFLCNFCSCHWHIFGFPLVLIEIFKYLKDATVNVLTQRLKITTIATSVYYSYDNNKAACDGKLNKPTKMADYMANQQTVLKWQTTQTTTAYSASSSSPSSSSNSAYTSSYCPTTSFTNYSIYYKSLKNLISLRQQTQRQEQQQSCMMPMCCCQQYNQHQLLHSHYYHHQRHYYHQYNRQKQQITQERQQQPRQLPHQHNKYISTIPLQLPSLLVFSRTLIILILLSSLWHTSEGFHGGGVKLSTNAVKTKYGLLRGIVVRSSPSLVEAYLGIPYASPPVGSLRFMPPITPSTWKNIRNADRFSPVCPQNVPIPPNGPEALLEVPRARLAQLRRLLPLLSNQSEDCLYLNIYVPTENHRQKRFAATSEELNDKLKLPTILFIHGESYEWNSGNPYDGSELSAHGNVIVVTMNFRLGIFGFLKTGGKESAQGNFGLMDLVAGLHWLKENLPAFGGDPQQITLLGHGTGAALANILVVSPVASDLIQHTVMVSGSALSPWAIQKNPLFVKRRVAEQTGCHGDMLYYDLAPCLRTKTVADLLAVKIDHPRFLVGFAPFIDGTVISPNSDSIGKLSLPLGSAIVSTSGIEYANFPKRNLIFCLTTVESHLDLSAQDLEFGFNETRRDRILRTYVRNNFHYHLNEIFAVLKNEYTEWDKAIRSPLSSRDATLQFLSDGHTASSLIKLGYMHSLRGGRGYFLHFKHRTVEEEYPQRTGSVRGEDVPFWLGLPISPLFPHNYTTQEKQISSLMLRYLTNFAKTGNPNQSSLISSLTSTYSLTDAAASYKSSAAASSSSQTADDSSEKTKRSSSDILNTTALTSSGPNKSNNIIEEIASAAARKAVNLAVLYNQRRTKRTYYKRHSRSNDDYSGGTSDEVNYFLTTNNNNYINNNNNNELDSNELPFWDAYDVVNQLYMELGNKAEIQSHYRGHKLSMWLNLIPQLHRHANMNDQSMRHHQFQDDLNNLNLYEGIVRAQIQTKPDDDDETLILPKSKPTLPPHAVAVNSTQKPQGSTTECGVDGAMFVAEMTTTQPPTDNRSLHLDSREKEMATASTGLIGNLEVLRRLSSKQFQSYTTALVATVAVGCFLLILNVLIFAGIYHQREKRARDAKTKEELQENDTSKNSSMLKLNAMGSETGSFNDNVAGVSGKSTVVFGEYSCYDEKSFQTKDTKLMVELPPATQLVDTNWDGCSTSTLDLLKIKHHNPLDSTYALSTVVPSNTESQTEHLMAVNNMEMATYNHLPMASSVVIDPALAATSVPSGLLSKRSSFVDTLGQFNHYDFASVQSSDQMSFKDIENAVKVSAAMNDGIMHDDDIPEPPPPPRSFQSMQQQQHQLQQTVAIVTTSASGSGGGGGGILRQAGATSATQTGGGKKRVHIQEISV